MRAGGLGERLTLVAIVAEQVALEAEFGEAGSIGRAPARSS